MIIPSSLVLLPGVFAVACAGFPIPTQTVGAVFTAAGIAASETVAPLPELVRARRAYDRARQGPAAQLDPADLVAAKENLDSAEKSSANESDVEETKLHGNRDASPPLAQTPHGHRDDSTHP